MRDGKYPSLASLPCINFNKPDYVYHDGDEEARGSNLLFKTKKKYSPSILLVREHQAESIFIRCNA